MGRVVRTFHAPGKIVLAGEYAVLDGAPGLVAAVDVGVSCTVDPSRPHAIETPDGDSRYVQPILEDQPGSFVFTNWNAPKLDSKPGLGGSAAACVVASLAHRSLNGLPTTPHALQNHATVVHRQVQGGGSGIDIAASAWGGVLRFQDGMVHRCTPIEPVIVFTGESAKTGPRLDQYLAYANRDRFVSRSAALVDRFDEDPIAAIKENSEILQAMAKGAGIHYWTPALETICALASSLGGAAKASGAGGGDVAIAVFPTPDTTERFRHEAGGLGLRVLNAKLSAGAWEVTQ